MSGESNLFGLARDLAELLGCPITIEDPDTVVVAYAGDHAGADRARVDTILNRQVPMQVRRGLERAGVFDRLRTSDDVVVVELAELEMRPRAVIAVRSDGELLGSIWAAPGGAPTPQQEAALRAAGPAVAHHLRTARRESDEAHRARADRLDRLLTGGETAVREAGKTALPGQLVAVAIRGSSPDQLERVASALTLHLNAVAPRSVCAVRDDTVHCVLAASSGRRILTDFVERVAGRSGFVAGIGDAVPAQDLPRSAATAAEVVTVLLRRRPGTRVADLRDVFADVLVDRVRGFLDTHADASPLVRLERHDAEHRTELVPTVDAYLSAAGSVARAAEILCVHPNTVRNRLHRIRVGCELDPDDPAVRLALMAHLAARRSEHGCGIAQPDRRGVAEPPQPPTGDREHTFRMRNQRIVVVGGGIVGLATAWHLQRGGAEVSVVERREIAAGSSWGNAGWLAPALTLPLPEPAILATGIRALLRPTSPVYVPPRLDPRLLGFLAGFARHCTDRKRRQALQVFIAANASAPAAYDELADAIDAGVDEPIKPAAPMLAAFATEADREGLLEEFRRVNSDGGRTDYALLDDAAVHDLEPALGPGVRCGLRIDGQRFINPGRFVGSLADAVKTAGAEIVTGRDVSGVESDGGLPRVRFSDGDALEADDVVLANGAWLGRLARRHGVRRLVQAGRGYSFTVRPESTPRNPIYFPVQRVACTPLGGPEDGLRVAGMMEFRDPDAPLDPRRVDAIVETAGRMFTGVDFGARRDEWVGSRPCTTDGLPLVGRTRTPGVHVAGGHGMWGVALGPLTGRLLARQILHGETGPVLRSFDPLR